MSRCQPTKYEASTHHGADTLSVAPLTYHVHLDGQRPRGILLR
jgi:hypothetical protein